MENSCSGLDSAWGRAEELDTVVMRPLRSWLCREERRPELQKVVDEFLFLSLKS